MKHPTIGCFILVKFEKSKFWKFFEILRFFSRLILPLASFRLRYRPQNPYSKWLSSNFNGFWVLIQMSKPIFDQVMAKIVSKPSHVSFLPFQRRCALLQSTIFVQKSSLNPVKIASTTFYCYREILVSLCNNFLTDQKFHRK